MLGRVKNLLIERNENDCPPLKKAKYEEFNFVNKPTITEEMFVENVNTEAACNSKYVKSCTFASKEFIRKDSFWCREKVVKTREDKKIFYKCIDDPDNCKLTAYMLFKKDVREVDFYLEKGSHNHSLKASSKRIKKEKTEPIVHSDMSSMQENTM